jgi:hypothetical protein
MNFLRGGLWLGLVGALAVAACGGVTSNVGTMEEEGGGGPGPDPECQAGMQKPADDGCNSCTCDSAGNWACTALACGDCTDGATRPAGDGCNQCMCSRGTWSCTQQMCEAPCALGDMRSDGCGSCTCVELEGRLTWACTANTCECVPGATKAADDGCNTCTCGETATWDCSLRDCSECREGDSRAAGDGCNTCLCIDGSWSCSMRACEPVVCAEGFGDCDGDPANGCETNLASDVQNCGACLNYCVHVGAYSRCNAGACELDRCDPPYADCNGQPDDGCEVPVGAGGCETRCEASATMLDPVPADDSCNCPAGMACVRNSTAYAPEDYCFPIPEGCQGGSASCLCMAECVCPGGTASRCTEDMNIGGMIVNCASGT